MYTHRYISDIVPSSAGVCGLSCYMVYFLHVKFQHLPLLRSDPNLGFMKKNLHLPDM